MVVKNDCLPVLDQCNGSEADTFKIPDSTFINTEEHTLAWISRSQIMRWRKHRKLEATRLKSQRKANRTSRLSKESWFGLSIEFDVNKKENASEETSTQVPNISPSTNGSDQVALDTTKEPPYLLNWSEKDRNDLLGAFFYGYVISQIPAARAAEIFGAKSLFLMTGLGAGLCSLVFPFAAKYSSGIHYAFVVRVIMGATQGALFPAVYVFLCEWLPRSERSKWLPFPSAFSRIGTIVMNFILPTILINYNWESVFYVSGVATLMWCLVFIIFSSNSPQQSYWLSKQELMYIEAHMEPRVGTSKVINQPTTSVTGSGFSINESSTKIMKKPSISWKKMATNKAILMLSLVMFTSEWSNVLLLIKLPGFLGPVFKLDIVEIGFWSSILIVVYCIQYPLSGYCASKLVSAEIESLNSLRVRKIFEAAAHIMQGSGCFMIAFSSDKAVVLVALFIIMLGRSTVGGGQCLMPPELSKGTVFAFANTIANLADIIGPMTVTWLVSDINEHSSWFSLWVLSGGLFFVGGLLFCLFAENSSQNYCRKPRAKGSISMSQAALTITDKAEPVEEIFKMDAFSRVSSEPKPKDIGQQHCD